MTHIYKLTRNKALWTSILIFSFAVIYAQNDTTNVKQPENDSTNAVDLQEGEFQDFIDTIFHNDTLILNNSLGWNNIFVNAGHFDSKDMEDTVRIPVDDSTSHDFFHVPFDNYVTCGFGYRRYLFHYGTDIKLHRGDSVRAAFDGVVRVRKYDRHGYGNVVVLRHENGLETIYGHLSKVLVNTDQIVKGGEVIGLGGSTGRSTGPHLHFEIRYLGEPFNPICFYDFKNHEFTHDTLVLTRANFNYLIDLRKARYCRIRSGDTLYKIARRYHTTISKLCKLNHISRRSLLRIGRKLRYS